MQIATVDERSRVTIGKKLATRYGKRFFVVPAKGELIFIPVGNKSPIKELEELGKNSGISKFSIKELKKQAAEEAAKEAASALAR